MIELNFKIEGLQVEEEVTSDLQELFTRRHAVPVTIHLPDRSIRAQVYIRRWAHTSFDPNRKILDVEAHA